MVWISGGSRGAQRGQKPNRARQEDRGAGGGRRARTLSRAPGAPRHQDLIAQILVCVASGPLAVLPPLSVPLPPTPRVAPPETISPALTT